MGQLGVVARSVCVAAIVISTARAAEADSVTITNGVNNAAVGFTSFSPDDFGTYGFLIGQQFDDEFNAAGTSNWFTPTYLTGPMLFVTTPGNPTSSVLLTGYRFWHDFVENPPPTPDGIAGPLVRTVTTSITATGNVATSAFRITDSASQGVQLDVSLVQTLTSDSVALTSQIDQVYTLVNNGTATTELVFVLMWDADLSYSGTNQDFDEVVGTGAGRCGVYQHDGDARWSIALGNGPMSTVPMASYFGGKEGFVPGTGPAFVPISAELAKQYIWAGHGIPDQWRGYVVGPGTSGAGESAPTLVGDGTAGTEYRLTLAVGATETIHIRRYYGTTTIPCFVSSKCGNGVLDTGELCDTNDTATCNGNTCTPSACGDGYRNMVAGEVCDTGGADTEACNGGSCTAPACGDGHVNVAASELCDDGEETAVCNIDCSPATCGDGYINVVAGEQCEEGELCDVATCTVTYTLGGGCAGCGAAGGGGGPALLLSFIVPGRRRRSARAA